MTETTMTNPSNEARDRDLLRVLAIFHWVFGGLALLASLAPAVMLAFGVFLASPAQQDPDASIAGVVLTCLGVVLGTLAFSYGTGMIVAGRGLWRQDRWVLCMVMAAVTCIFFPYGTVLGALSVVMLAKNGVRERFSS